MGGRGGGGRLHRKARHQICEAVAEGVQRRWVDEVVEDAPWVVTEDFIAKHAIDFVTHDALPYSDATGQGKDVYENVRARVTCCVSCQQSHCSLPWHSTSES